MDVNSDYFSTINLNEILKSKNTIIDLTEYVIKLTFVLGLIIIKVSLVPFNLQEAGGSWF